MCGSWRVRKVIICRPFNEKLFFNFVSQEVGKIQVAAQRAPFSIPPSVQGALATPPPLLQQPPTALQRRDTERGAQEKGT